MLSRSACWSVRLISTVAVAAEPATIMIVMDCQRGSQLTQGTTLALSATTVNNQHYEGNMSVVHLRVALVTCKGRTGSASQQ